MEDGDGLAARDAGGEAGGVLFEITRRESQEVVDDNVNRSADGVGGKVGVVHGFGEDALSGKGGVAVDQQGEIFFASAFASTVLLGASAAYRYRIDGFEVAGI